MKIVSIVVVVVGVGLLAVSLLADVVNVGGSAGFGTDQTLGAVAGAVLTGAGLFLLRKK